MGRVYLGYSPGGRAVAVKIVHPELARDAEFMARFQREVQAAEAVSGAYTAPVVGAGPADTPPWLATVFVAGPSLADLVARMGPLPEAAVWRLAGGLIEALQAIHAQGLVHRDLKPGNVLLAADGPRVIDFGISRALHGASMTATRMTMGTPAYMSPEQAQGQAVGPPSDVFSLGSVLAFAATGSAPFGGGQAFAIAYRVVSSDPDLRRVTEGPYGPHGLGLRGLVAACLAKDPASRPALSQLIADVSTASGAFPSVQAGRFWPEQVAAVIESRVAATTAVPMPPAPSASPPGGAPGPVTLGPGRPPVTPAQGPVPRRNPLHQSYPVPGPDGMPPRRRAGRRWAAVTAGAVGAAAVIGVALALTLSAQSGGGPSVTSSTSTSAPGGSPGASSASASSSLIAVTVCSDPTGGCTYVGASQIMEIQPRQIYLSADGSRYVDGLTWTAWGRPQATAAGTLKVNDCTPSCVQGTFSPYPATVTLAGLKPYGTGLEAYSTMVVRSPSARMTFSYTKDLVP
jgi:serine/threonine protein kinase